MQESLKQVSLVIWEVAKIAIIALAIVVPVRMFLFQPFIVRGASMEPNFHTNDYLIVDELSYQFRAPERGEVVVFKFPKNQSQRYVKRIIGLPGEIVEIRDGLVYIQQASGEPEELVLDEAPYLFGQSSSRVSLTKELADGEYFVMGDNRLHSSDSRVWGALPEDLIIGRVFVRLWPPTDVAAFEAPTY